MQAEIITIGDEILIGQIVDTNSTFIGKALNEIRLEIAQISSIRDEPQQIKNSLADALKRSQVIIITGGLGPTNDDLTKKVLCEFFDDKLVENKEVLKHIEWLFENHINTPISEMNRQQAFLPSKAKALKNEYGTASGMWFEQDGKIAVSLPGVPYEMKGLIEDQVVPKLRDKFNLPVILHKTVLTYGMGESGIAELIEDWENDLPGFIRLAYLPSLGRVRLRLTARGKDRSLLEKAVDEKIEMLQTPIGKYIHGIEGKGSLEKQIADQFTRKDKTLALAESCTGGRIASRFTSIPGASAYFQGGIVVYATPAKKNVLGIEQKTIAEFSVVSAEITEEMARKAKVKFHADYALATTGNAGPTKGDSEAEIGTVFIALAHPEGVDNYHLKLGNQREKVTEKAVMKALGILYNKLKFS
jgi:nicotinamide-nucleotide amidase